MKMACGMVPAISWAPPPSRSRSWSAPSRRSAARARRNDVRPRSGGEDLSPRSAGLPVAAELARLGRGRVHVRGDVAGCGGQLLAETAQLQDLVAQRGGAFELQVAGG